ncbi:MAG: succinylglutamate desuccinylase/aspartoacylase family protein, partial [Blastocatellia bacterium]|nr:succinylglutamate desuccinylase/aspartoacylase family protein [Blastocatellia bacterium]
MMQLLMDTPTKNSITTNFKRIIGGYVGSSSGPLLVCIGGIHGNEPAGVLALKRVIEKLQSLKPAFKGEFLALSGNLTALNMGCRFIDHDLNRMWSNEKMAALKTGLGENISEKDEQRELLQLIEEALKRKSGSALFLDLHTTSAPGAPFALVSDSLVNRNLALQLSAPLILGLE